MTLKRFILGLLTVFAVILTGLSLIESWNQPQIQSRLELYQTDLVLQAAEWQAETAANPSTPTASPNLRQARNTLIGTDPIKTALEQYQKERQSAQTSLEKAEAELAKVGSVGVSAPEPKPLPQAGPVNDPSLSAQQQQLQTTRKQLQVLIDELDLRLGTLQIHQNQLESGLKTWSDLLARSSNPPTALAKTAEALIGLWSNPPRLVPEAEQQIKKQLDGWFEYQALAQLYQLQQRQDALATLRSLEQKTAQRALMKLALVGSIPTVGFLGGVGLLIFLVSQRVMKGKDALLARNGDLPWTTPWTGETVWQVFVLGFFVMGQILVPLLLPIAFHLLGINPATFDERTRAFSVLVSYAFLSLGGLLVLYISLKRFLPLPTEWFRIDWRGNWFFWGLGGYLVALPLVILVSLLNQTIWQGQGGSNPILPIVLEGKDRIALAIFFSTASIAAPLFEEFMFRGFLLPSLTRYLPVSGAIIVSSLLFAIAHLSLSEVLPLAVLGCVLGVVYTRSRNLLAPMFLHSLWNSGTLVSLYILGSASG